MVLLSWIGGKRIFENRAILLGHQVLLVEVVFSGVQSWISTANRMHWKSPDDSAAPEVVRLEVGVLEVFRFDV